MTPEQSVTSGEKPCLRSLEMQICQSGTLTEHVPSKAQSPSMTEPAHMAVSGQMQTETLLTWQQMRPNTKSQHPLQFCSAHGDLPVIRAHLICGTREPAAICGQLHTQTILLRLTSVQRLRYLSLAGYTTIPKFEKLSVSAASLQLLGTWKNDNSNGGPGITS